MGQILWRNSRQFSGTRGALRWWSNALGSQVPPRGFVWMAHGMGEHSGRYEELASYLNQFGFDVLAPDHPGHGLSRSDGGQSWLPPVEALVEEFRDAQSWWIAEGPLAKKGIAKTPWYLFGHSLGALVGLALILEGKKSGDAEFAQRAYFNAPPLRVRQKIPAWKEQMALAMNKFGPNIELPNGIDARDLTDDAAVLGEYSHSTLIHHNASSALYLSMKSLAARLVAHPADLEVPVCLSVGARDPVVCPGAVKEFFETLRTHKRFIEFPAFKHECFNELGRSAAFQALGEWFL